MTTTTTTTTGKRTSRASRSAAQAQADQQPQEQPEPQQQEQPKAGQPKAAKPKLGPSGYRERFGITDADIVAAVYEAAKAKAEAGEPGWAQVAGWDDLQILGIIGWAYTRASAVAKVAKVLAASA